MVYEWDEKRARRAHLARVGLVTLAGLTMVVVPTWIAMTLNVI